MFEDFVPFFLAMSSSSGIFPRRLGAPQMRPVRLVVRTPPFHGGNTGSSPVRVAISPQLSHPRVGVNCGSTPKFGDEAFFLIVDIGFNRTER